MGSTAKDLTSLASKFKTSAAGVALGKKIFSPNASTTVSQTEIASFLASAGIASKEINITLSAAQVLWAGGAFYNTASKATSVGQILRPGLSTINTVMGFLGSIGLLDPNSPGARIMNFGTGVLALIAVPGINILAAIGVVVNAIFEFFFPPDERPIAREQLKMLGYQQIQQWYKDEVNAQKGTIIENQKLFLSGKQSMFEMLGAIATKAPILFPHFVPDLNCFIPPQTLQKCVTNEKEAKYGGLFGLFRSSEIVRETVCVDYQAAVIKSKSSLAEAFIRRYLYEPFYPYFLLQQMPEALIHEYGYPPAARIEAHPNPVYPRIPVSDLALLSMFPPYFKRIEDNFDLTYYLSQLGVTPSDLGHKTLLERELGYEGFYGEKKTLRLPAITFNGVDYFETSDAKYNQKTAADNYSVELARRTDKTGDVKTLYNLRFAYELVREWGVMPYPTPEMSKRIPGLELKNPALMQLDYRNVENVWACYSMVFKMRQDPFFQDVMQSFNFLGRLVNDAEQVESRFNEIYHTVVARELNKQSKQTIADYYGMPADKLEMGYHENGLAFVKNGG
jgi:hypothetical protein